MPPLRWLLGLVILAMPFAVPLAWGNDDAWSLRVWLDPAATTLSGEMTLAPVSGELRLHPELRLEAASQGEDAIAVERLAPGRYRLDTLADEAPLTLRWQGPLPRQGAIGLAERGGLLPGAIAWHPRVEAMPPGPLTLTLHLPEGQQGVASGSLVAEHAGAEGPRLDFHHPLTAEASLATGPWAIREREAEGVRLRVLFPAPLDEAFAETYLDAAADHLAAFQARLGPFPFASFSMAASPAPLGVAFPGFTLLGERVIPLPFIPHTSLAHELMHGWWGAGVRVDYAAGNWAEALTTYLADYALDEARGQAGETRRRWLRDLAALPEANTPALVDFQGGPDAAERLVGYQQGALLFHQLRRRLGDDAFEAGLRRFADTWMHREASWSELIDALAGDAAEGQALMAFATPWLEAPGRPTLGLEAVRLSQDEDGSWRVSGELVQDGGVWPMRVPLVLEGDTADGRRIFEVPLEEARHSFVLESETRPRRLLLDPAFELPRQLPPPPILRRLALAPALRLASLTPGLDARPLIGETPIADDADLTLVVGETRAVVEWLADAGIDGAATAPATQGQARLWLLPERPIALLSAESPEALAALARRWQHHGQHGYLVVDDRGETLAVGGWEEERESDGETPSVDFAPPGSEGKGP
ncbi:M1 family aminopeptidase [Halomonas salifodinae]|uniref:M1 family aminopeptidase n=1 Tax=Halomonas salifodinae TaxID=438745 RepID=UPI0033B1E83F